MLIPSKFRNIVWLRRGGFIVVDPLEETAYEKSRRNTKVTAILANVVNANQQKEMIKQNIWYCVHVNVCAIV